MPDLQCSVSNEGGLTVVAASGDVDVATAGALWEAISAQVTPSSAVVLDCAGITFMDSMGLQSLLRAYRYADEQQGSFALVGIANSYVDRVLELTGMTQVIPHFTDVEAARTDLAGRPGAPERRA